ncbi:MAG: FKBP-type peptidyl-prolyl cis-trans isomerase [Gammaproteobacteria bacterium]|nr:FKBP-type peptidyl-prolyl cis-trans isomerase [Gammaproteobacteria bacterium]NIR97320.1 FKBP-type peptidyl-prolyl cis-trans isomerase [Gammaproteobacteria bacterium]NIT63363.1 FKBP-type peptidyl-prolyl cis-trans isomerase [Gammaproteobacteria bacterium]NIV20290.1 hypothetical protein [Gammaproteobacteria bacterium]NIX10707.1 hypothetical protein [Gammaproteobacteria bacterium]
MRYRVFPLLVAVAAAPLALAEDVELGSEQQKFSYAIGYQIGQSLQREGIEVEVPALVQAITDVLSGAEARLSPAQMQAAVRNFQQQKAQERQATAQRNKEAGEKFLAANREKEGVQELPSGLQYEVMQEGTGDTPKADDMVEVHYRGTLLDGTEFDSSYSRGKPTTLPLSGVIKGWQEALRHMREGAKWKLFIPPELAYGERGAGENIGPNETLVFEVELLSVK